MIPARAIKVYKTTNFSEIYVTTVFTPYDFAKIRDRLLKDSSTSSVTDKTVKNTVLAKFVPKGVKLRSNHKVVTV